MGLPFKIYIGEYNYELMAQWCVRCEDWIPSACANGTRMVGTAVMATDWHINDHLYVWREMREIDKRLGIARHFQAA